MTAGGINIKISKCRNSLVAGNNNNFVSWYAFHFVNNRNGLIMFKANAMFLNMKMLFEEIL